MSKIKNLKNKFEMAVQKEAIGKKYFINMRKTSYGMCVYTALVLNLHVGNVYDDELSTDLVELTRYQFRQRKADWKIPDLSSLETGNLFMTRDEWEMLVQLKK